MRHCPGAERRVRGKVPALTPAVERKFPVALFAQRVWLRDLNQITPSVAEVAVMMVVMVMMVMVEAARRHHDDVRPIVAVVMVVMMIIAVVMVMVVMIVLRHLDVIFPWLDGLLLLDRLQNPGGVRDRLEQFGVGIDFQCV